MRSTRSMLAKRRDLIHLLNCAATSPGMYLQDSVLQLRRMLQAEVGIIYRTAPVAEGMGHELELCYQVGISPVQMSGLRNLFAKGSPIYAYNPADPEPEQRNRLMSLRRDQRLDAAKLRRADEYFRQLDSSVYAQHRILLCDGGRFLGRIGVMREAALTRSEWRAFESLIPYFIQTLRIDRALRDSTAAAAGLTAALNMFEGAWFVVTETCRVEFANRAAERALAADGPGTRAQIMNAIARRDDQPGVEADVSELRYNGMPPLYLVGLRAVRRLESRLLAARRAWGVTTRQLEILALVATGQSNKEIGTASGLAERTVEAHVTSLLRASGSDGRAQLVAKFWTLTGLGTERPSPTT